MLKNSKQNLIDSMNKSNMNDGVKEIIRVITSTIESKRK